MDSPTDDSSAVRVPAGSAIVRKGEPSATELAQLQVNLTSAEDDQLDAVLEESLKRYCQLSLTGQLDIDRHIAEITEVMEQNGWNTPVSEDHHSREDAPGADERPAPRSRRESGRLRLPRRHAMSAL